MDRVFRFTAVLLMAALVVGACHRGGRASSVSGSDNAQAAAGPDSFRPGDVVPAGAAEAYEAGDSVPAALVAALGPAAFFSAAPIDSVVFARMDGRSYKEGCPVAIADLRYNRVLHKDLAGRTLVGEMVVNRSISDDLLEIFRELYDAGYPIERMRLIDDYDADDEASMSANNSSCFKYRRKPHMSAVSIDALG